MLRGHRRSQVWHLEPQFWRKASLDLSSYALPSYLPSQGSWSFTESGIINTQLHGCLLPGSIPNGGSLTMCRLWRSGSSTIGYNCTQTSGTMILGSRQGLPRLEPVASDIGDGSMKVRDEIKILGIHLDPTLSMNAQLKVLIKTSNFHILALQHGCRGLAQIYRDDRLQSHHFSVSSLLGLTIVTDSCAALQSWISANSNVFRMFLRELCFKQRGIPAQNRCSNSYTGFESIRG